METPSTSINEELISGSDDVVNLLAQLLITTESEKSATKGLMVGIIHDYSKVYPEEPISLLEIPEKLATSHKLEGYTQPRVLMSPTAESEKTPDIADEIFNLHDVNFENIRNLLSQIFIRGGDEVVKTTTLTIVNLIFAYTVIATNGVEMDRPNDTSFTSHQLEAKKVHQRVLDIKLMKKQKKLKKQ